RHPDRAAAGRARNALRFSGVRADRRAPRRRRRAAAARLRLRPLLRGRWLGRIAAHDRRGAGTGIGAADGGAVERAGRAALRRHAPGRRRRQAGRALRRANRGLPGGATISGFAKPGRISVGPPTTGGAVPPDDRVRVPPRLAAASRRGKPAGLGAGRQDTLEFRDSRRFRDSTGRPVGVCSVPVFQKAIGALRGPVLFAALAGLGVGLGCGNSGTLKVTKVAVATQKATGNLAFYLDVRNNGKPVPGLVEK